MRSTPHTPAIQYHPLPRGAHSDTPSEINLRTSSCLEHMSLKVPVETPMLSLEGIDRPRYHSFQSGIRSRLTGKDILVFCDETGKDGKLGTNDKTNVWKLYQLVLSQRIGDQVRWGPLEKSTLRQNEIIYLPGIGSGSGMNPYNLLARSFGSTVVETIIEAYLHITNHYEAGSRIYLFGYSRGAFVVRKVTSLIYRIGIIRKREELLKLWDHERLEPWNFIDSPPRGSAIRIQALVVWDTVGATRSVHPKSKIEADILGMSDEELPPNVDHAFHVVAFHENRKLFRVTLFRPDSNQEDKLKEVWFPGSHSDVGGGGIKNIGLPSVSLIWIIGELQSICSLSISHDDLEYPARIESLSPSDAYRDSPKWKRLVDECETRLSFLRNTSLVHETVLYLKNFTPDYLDPRSNLKSQLLTINDLGSIGWDIQTGLVARNSLETLKYMNAMMARKSFKEQVVLQRRSDSLFTSPRSSIVGMDQTRSTNNHNPQPHRFSNAGNSTHSISVPVPPNLPIANARHGGESHVLTHSELQSFVTAQSTLQEPIRDTRHLARHNTDSGGVLPFQEPVPGAWRSSKPNFVKLEPRVGHRGAELNMDVPIHTPHTSILSHNIGSQHINYGTESLEMERSNSTGIISGTMSMLDVLEILSNHGCKDVTEKLDFASTSEHPISTGGFGDVYSGRLKTGDRVAIKCLRLIADTLDDGGQRIHVKNAAHELYAWSKCKHPHVIDLIGVTQHRNQIAMISSWMDNKHLNWFLSQHPEFDCCILSTQISDGVTYLHSMGIVHGDIKGLNILVDQHYQPKLADFGSALLGEYSSLRFTGSTRKPELTLRWAVLNLAFAEAPFTEMEHSLQAPELIADETGPSKPGDVYALGITILEIFTRSVPFADVKRDISLCYIVVVQKKYPTRPDMLHSDSIKANRLWSLLVECWAYEPQDRLLASEVYNEMKDIKGLSV
ncbi:unnamed protein product [Rhizoctonia solani]|uniref:Protein kinase domain-containing protein n=1 Tax=Rhizoctonia solani TaxID=456999 RepID=A0A8H3HIH4_9AGAM|nr:unnamed protein product [Rhizoctonia solani]